MRVRCYNGFIALAGFLAVTASASGAAPTEPTLQRNCQFTYVGKIDATSVQKGEVNLPVTVANRGTAGRVIVKGSGDYTAKAVTFDSGAVEFFFKTGVSEETMTIGRDGDAIWQIDFTNGDLMAYTGHCKAPRITSQ